MSREEAIKIFNTVLFFGKCDAPKEDIDESLKMAIEALEEQQNPNSIRINFVGEEEVEEFKEYLKNQQPCIKAQEPILDKLRADIEEYKSRQLALGIGVEDLEKGKQVALEYVLNIIDEYKESEVEI